MPWPSALQVQTSALRSKCSLNQDTATSANLVASETRSFVGAIAEWLVRGFPAAA